MEKNFSAISRLPPATSIIRNRPKSNLGPPKEHWQKLIDESVYYKVILKYFKYIFSFNYYFLPFLVEDQIRLK